jgi:putative nucleotidyltransferase with HDIG domain
LISNEEPAARYVREKLISEGGYNVSLELDQDSALGAFRENNFGVVIINFGSTNLSNTKIVQELRKINPDCIVIALVEEVSSDILKEISRTEIYDFVSKPVDLEKLFFLVNKGTQLHAVMASHRKLEQGLKEHNAALQKQNTLLAKRIEESAGNLARLYDDLRATYMRTIKVLAQAIDARDHYTHSHSQNVVKYALTIAGQMGLSAKEIELIREACELHDLGKIGIEDNILSKPSSLTAEEWTKVKRHPETGARILEPLTFLNEAIGLIRQHHEHFDGSGYPDGRRGEDILLGARIIHLADAYESMCSPRSYRKVPFTKEQAIAEIKKNSGTQFDPQVVEAFLKVVDKL